MERMTHYFMKKNMCNKSGDVCEQQQINPLDEDCCCDCEIHQKMIDKLADYENAEENGFLFRFPCRIGDEVFFHWYCSDGTILAFPAIVKQINIGTFMLRKGIQYKIEPKGSAGMLKIFYHSDFGFSIFTTKEAAEAALRKMQEDKQ